MPHKQVGKMEGAKFPYVKNTQVRRAKYGGLTHLVQYIIRIGTFNNLRLN